MTLIVSQRNLAASSCPLSLTFEKSFPKKFRSISFRFSIGDATASKHSLEIQNRFKWDLTNKNILLFFKSDCKGFLCLSVYVLAVSLSNSCGTFWIVLQFLYNQGTYLVETLRKKQQHLNHIK